MVSNWTEVHNNIVMEKLQGASNTELAMKYNKNESTISVIFNSHQARALRDRVTSRVLEEQIDNLPEKTKRMILRLHERLEEFIDDDTLAKNNRLAYTETTVKVLGAITKKEVIASSGPVNITNNHLTVLNDPKKRDLLALGLAEAEEVRVLHAGINGESIDRSTK